MLGRDRVRVHAGEGHRPPVLLAVSTHGDEVKAKGASGKLETLAGKRATGFVPLFDFPIGPETDFGTFIGNAGISQSVEPGRFDVRDSAGNALVPISW